jgi:type II secretory pathway predicted ATPase ExeA/septal ring-binding cell division protein DamX
MYLEHFNLHYEPFKEEPDVDIFYPGGQREAVCKALISDVIVGKPLIKFIGREGSGKTLICRIVANKVPGNHDVVYIDNPIGSFDDLLRVICLDLGMHPSGGHESVNFVHELHGLLDKRRQQNKKVLIIVDEAEKLFLATLERLVRFICEAEESDVLRIVLAGRPGLDANLEQLAIYCANVDINAGHYLEPLDEEETSEYLMYRLEGAGLSLDQHEDFISDGAVAKIHASSQGNMRMINILAEESLQNSSSVKSFMVLLDHVTVEDDTDEHATNLLTRVTEKLEGAGAFFQENRLLAGAGAAAIILVIVIGMLVSGGEKQAELVAPFSPAEKEKAIEALSGVTAVEPPVGEVSVPVEEQQQKQLTEKGIQPAPEPAAVEKEVEEDVIIESLDTPVTLKVNPIANQEKVEPEQPNVIIVRSAGKKRAPDTSPSNIAPPSVTPEATVQELVEKPVEKVFFKGRDGELLFRDRRRASAGWLAEAFRGGYTIQLMMLTSNNAEGNLKRMLVQDQYHDIKDQLYILRKKSTPPTLFVYYGIYDSMEQARQKRNIMPVFLRKHHPYAVSINDALKKTED